MAARLSAPRQTTTEKGTQRPMRTPKGGFDPQAWKPKVKSSLFFFGLPAPRQTMTLQLLQDGVGHMSKNADP